jgi:hypothetical protein
MTGRVPQGRSLVGEGSDAFLVAPTLLPEFVLLDAQLLLQRLVLRI